MMCLLFDQKKKKDDASVKGLRIRFERLVRFGLFGFWLVRLGQYLAALNRFSIQIVRLMKIILKLTEFLVKNSVTSISSVI